MKIFKTFQKTLHLALLVVTTTLFAQTPQQLHYLDTYFEKSLKEWQIPGMAIAIVNADSIVFSKGYGFANLEKKQPVDGNTLFAVASNSKAFTATAIAKLVEEGKLNWDDKVIDFLPYFRMYDDYVTNHFTITDLLCHRSGLKTFSGDLLWYGTTLSAEEIIRGQEYLKPTTEFRTTFGYSNIAFLAAGKIIEKVTGESWQEYVQQQFLSPLQMNRTLTSTRQLQNTDNVSVPYFLEGNKNHPLAWLNWDNIAPAGALISSANDFAKWLQLNINKGTFNDKQYFSTTSLTTLTTPHVNFSIRENEQNNTYRGYGLGWDVQDYEKTKIVSHGGGYDGMISKTFFIPEKRLGVVILTNNLNYLPSALTNKILDVLLTDTFDKTDWSAKYLEYRTKQDVVTKMEQENMESERGTLGKNPLPIADFTGIYKDKMYGTVTVSEKNNILHFTMDKTPIFYADLKHWNNLIFTFRFPMHLSSLPTGKMQFTTNENSKITGLKIVVENPDFDFTEFDFVKQ